MYAYTLFNWVNIHIIKINTRPAAIIPTTTPKLELIPVTEAV